MSDEESGPETPKAEPVMEASEGKRRIENGSAPNSRQLRRKRSPAKSYVAWSARSKRPKKSQETDLDMSWICAECKEAECMMNPDADQFLVCEGSCRRLFHYPCAGLSEMPPEDEKYICKDCSDGRHACAYCKEFGQDNEQVFKCSRAKCGLYFHEACLSILNVDFDVIPPSESCNQSLSQSPVTVLESPSSANEVKTERGRRVFTCPAHQCWSCNQADMKQQEAHQAEAEQEDKAATKKGRRRKKGRQGPSHFCTKNEPKLFRCLECPISYHISCIPMSAKFHELAILCHEHAQTCKLPDLDPEGSMQQEVEDKADKFLAGTHGSPVSKIRRRGNTKNLCFPFSGDDLSTTEHAIKSACLSRKEDGPEVNADGLFSAFCLPCSVRDEVHAKPPVYKHVHTLQYDPSNRPQRVPVTTDRCNCVKVCDESCFNRLTFTECFGDLKKTGKGNCGVGAGCGNRAISQRKFIKCRPEREQGKGWGLKTLEKARQGQIIHEYVGEIIDAETKEARLKDWAADHPNDPNFYIMALGTGWFIDARDVANLSRFINHSCDPNCIIHPINSGGLLHNGVIALRDIAPGEFLSYDYHFETQQGDRFVCRCGAKNCRGTMKQTSATTQLETKKSASEKWEAAKSQYEKDKKFVTDHFEEEATRRIAYGETVPGSGGNGELVANGPQMRHRNSVVRNRIFLWRNVVRGDDLAQRLARLHR